MLLHLLLAFNIFVVTGLNAAEAKSASAVAASVMSRTTEPLGGIRAKFDAIFKALAKHESGLLKPDFFTSSTGLTEALDTLLRFRQSGQPVVRKLLGWTSKRQAKVQRSAGHFADELKNLVKVWLQRPSKNDWKSLAYNFTYLHFLAHIFGGEAWLCDGDNEILNRFFDILCDLSHSTVPEVGNLCSAVLSFTLAPTVRVFNLKKYANNYAFFVSKNFLSPVSIAETLAAGDEVFTEYCNHAVFREMEAFVSLAESCVDGVGAKIVQACCKRLFGLEWRATDMRDFWSVAPVKCQKVIKAVVYESAGERIDVMARCCPGTAARAAELFKIAYLDTELLLDAAKPCDISTFVRMAYAIIAQMTEPFFEATPLEMARWVRVIVQRAGHFSDEEFAHQSRLITDCFCVLASSHNIYLWSELTEFLRARCIKLSCAQLQVSGDLLDLCDAFGAEKLGEVVHAALEGLVLEEIEQPRALELLALATSSFAPSQFLGTDPAAIQQKGLLWLSLFEVAEGLFADLDAEAGSKSFGDCRVVLLMNFYCELFSLLNEAGALSSAVWMRVYLALVTPYRRALHVSEWRGAMLEEEIYDQLGRWDKFFGVAPDADAEVSTAFGLMSPPKTSKYYR